MTRPLQLGFLLAVAGLFLGGLVRLMHLRLETGDVYPRYSSLRTDPFGCKALFESLDRLPGVRTRRNHDSLAGFTSDQRCTIFTTGLTPAHFCLTGSAEVAGVIDHVAHGSRWIMAVRTIRFADQLWIERTSQPNSTCVMMNCTLSNASAAVGR